MYKRQAILFAKNLYRPIFAPAMTDDQVAKLARVMVVVLGLISLVLAIYKSATLVGLLLTCLLYTSRCV